MTIPNLNFSSTLRDGSDIARFYTGWRPLSHVMQEICEINSVSQYAGKIQTGCPAYDS